ncbi:unnamed protein product, partial [Closterium sp. Naga37s-1]
MNAMLDDLTLQRGSVGYVEGEKLVGSGLQVAYQWGKLLDMWDEVLSRPHNASFVNLGHGSNSKVDIQEVLESTCEAFFDNTATSTKMQLPYEIDSNSGEDLRSSDSGEEDDDATEMDEENREEEPVKEVVAEATEKVEAQAVENLVEEKLEKVVGTQESILQDQARPDRVVDQARNNAVSEGGVSARDQGVGSTVEEATLAGGGGRGPNPAADHAARTGAEGAHETCIGDAPPKQLDGGAVTDEGGSAHNVATEDERGERVEEVARIVVEGNVAARAGAEAESNRVGEHARKSAEPEAVE